MVAEREVHWSAEAAPDYAKQFDPGTTAQGHVSQRIKQHFRVLRERVAEHRPLRLRATEFLITDQFGNLYVTFRSVLPDGEIYDVTDWVAVQKPNGIRLVKDFKRFRAFDDAMMSYLQDKAFVALGREVAAIMKSRMHGAVTLMTTGEEMTKCAHLLADQIITSMSDKNGLNSPTQNAGHIHGGIHDPVRSGVRGMDQATQLGSEAPQALANEGNCCPPLPPLERGTK